jgi:hypothetical protein
VSTLSKVFVVLNLFFAIIFATSVVGLYAKRGKWKDKYNVEVEQHQTTRQNFEQEVAELQKQKAILQRNKDTLEQQAEDLAGWIDSLKMLNRNAMDQYLFNVQLRQQSEARVEEMLNRLNERANQIAHLNTIVHKLNHALKTAEENEANAKTEKIDAENQLNQVLQQLADLNKHKSKIEKDLHHYTWVIEKLIERGVDVSDVFNNGTLPTKSVSARVLAVEPDVNIVMLSAGKRQGVEVGYRFTVFRQDEYIGKVEVEKVLDDFSTARIIPEVTPKEIQEDDNASTN